VIRLDEVRLVQRVVLLSSSIYDNKYSLAARVERGRSPIHPPPRVGEPTFLKKLLLVRTIEL
jgi:hypothetical protein